MIISLIGFMGAGKTTLGREMAQSLRCPFIDLDAYIEEKEGHTIREIFGMHDEGYFRKLEEKYLEDVLEDHVSENPETLDDMPSEEGEEESETMPARKCTLVISLGGGIITNPACCSLISRFTYCIYLKTDIGVIFQRLEKDTSDHPMLDSDGKHTLMETISRLLAEREPLYMKLARKTITTKC